MSPAHDPFRECTRVGWEESELHGLECVVCCMISPYIHRMNRQRPSISAKSVSGGGLRVTGVLGIVVFTGEGGVVRTEEKYV